MWSTVLITKQWDLKQGHHMLSRGIITSFFIKVIKFKRLGILKSEKPIRIS